MKTLFAAFFLPLTLFSAVLWAYPEPAIVQKVNEWTIQTNYSQPKQINLTVPGLTESKRYWYIILSITNNSSLESVDFYPVCQLMTDTFQIIPADKKVPSGVFDLVKLKHQGSYPFLESLDFKDHRLFRGEDNTRDIAIIWPDFDPKAREISLFISGLSNETTFVEHPKLKDENGEPKKIFLQKTLQLKYAAAGDPKLRANMALKQIQTNWVMR